MNDSVLVNIILGIIIFWVVGMILGLTIALVLFFGNSYKLDMQGSDNSTYNNYCDDCWMTHTKNKTKDDFNPALLPAIQMSMPK